MIKEVVNVLSSAEADMDGQVKLFAYRNMCGIPIEANPMQLLSVIVRVNGQEQHLEDVATVIADPDNEKYAFKIYPNDDAFTGAICEGIFEAQPYVKLENKIEKTDIAEIPYILCTMPEVDKDRRDIYNNILDAFYKSGDSKMTLSRLTGMGKGIVAAGVTGNPEDIKEAKDEVDGTYKPYKGQLDNEYERKKKEIEEAYQKYCEEHPEAKENQSEEKEQPSENNNSSSQSMSMADDDE